MSKPDIPKQRPVQEAKQPDLNALIGSRRKGPLAAGTLLTGPSGIDTSTVGAGATTLLGG